MPDDHVFSTPVKVCASKKCLALSNRPDGGFVWQEIFFQDADFTQVTKNGVFR
jgi:hypothetical protein